MIIEREFAPDSHWSIRTLAKRLGLSMAPVNEAVKRLEQEGLLKTRPRSGIDIRQLSATEKSELGIIRQAIEVQAARLIAINTTVKKLSELRQTALKIHKLLDQGQRKQAAYLDVEFHMKMVALSNCKLLTDKYEQISTMCMVASGEWEDWKGYKATSMESHIRLVDTLASGNPDKAERAIRRHIKAEFVDPG